uniref:Cytochrome P450 n=1 Tax=Strigamia maritima TaxID=126957 RepID=T1JDH6_STRMM
MEEPICYYREDNLALLIRYSEKNDLKSPLLQTHLATRTYAPFEYTVLYHRIQKILTEFVRKMTSFKMNGINIRKGIQELFIIIQNFIPIQTFLILKERNPFTYLPFGAGPRNCIAKRFALMEAKLVVMVHMLYNYRFQTRKENEYPIKMYKGTGLLQPMSLKLVLQKRVDETVELIHLFPMEFDNTTTYSLSNVQKCAKLVKWYVECGSKISVGMTLFAYHLPHEMFLRIYKSMNGGRIAKILIANKEIIKAGDSIFILENCPHTVDTNDKCAECGLDDITRVNAITFNNRRLSVGKRFIHHLSSKLYRSNRLVRRVLLNNVIKELEVGIDEIKLDLEYLSPDPSQRHPPCPIHEKPHEPDENEPPCKRRRFDDFD